MIKNNKMGEYFKKNTRHCKGNDKNDKANDKANDTNDKTMHKMMKENDKIKL